MGKIADRLNPLSSLPQFENHFSKRQVAIAVALIGLTLTVAFTLAACQVLLYDSRSGGYMIAMVSWLPIFSVSLFSIMRAHSLEALYKSGAKEEHIQAVARRSYIQSAVLTVVMVSIIVFVYVWFLLP